MKLSKEMIDQIKKEIADKNISRNKHPEFDLFILNYTNRCQVLWHWSEATRLCRGLIVDGEYNVIARSYQKFFGYGQEGSPEMPKGEKYHVYDKSDGSLGVRYKCPDGTYRMSSRGSFTSPMAVQGTIMLQSLYSDCVFNPLYSYSVEIIYPQNRIIVDYKNDYRLVLHGVHDTETGKLLPLREEGVKTGMPTAKLFGVVAFEDPTVLMTANKYVGQEGFVLVFEKSGLLLKLKYEEYKQAHYLSGLVTPRKMFRRMIEEGSLNGLRVPRMPQWYVDKVDTFEKEVGSLMRGLEVGLRESYKNIIYLLGEDSTPKDFAIAIKDNEHKAGLFNIAHGDEKRFGEYVLETVRRSVLKGEDT